VTAVLLSLLTDKPFSSYVWMSRDQQEALRDENKNSILSLKNQRNGELY
jgi:hypothetical protein